MSIEPRKLTEHEANQLFEATFLMISQQNLAEKQKNLKNNSGSYPQSLDLSYQSPNKSQIFQFKHQTPELISLGSTADPEKIPEKVIRKTRHKFSTDKEQSCNEGNELSLQSHFRLNSKEQIGNDLNDKVTIAPKNQQKISKEMQIEDPSNQSQMKQDSHQDLYLQRYIKQIKRDLEIRSRGKICKSQEINHKTGQVIGYHFYCKNDSNCSFDCSLEYTGERSTRSEKLYKLVVRSQNHAKSCIEEEEEITFMKLTKIIDDMEKPIIRLLSQNVQLKPKEILMTMAQKIGEQNHKFIYKGLSSKSYHKAAKKYFDNLIYKVKNQMGAI